MEIVVRGLGKTYDGHNWAVRHLDLSIPSGSIFGLIGPNGAGKSTTLRMLATVLEPTEGDVAHGRSAAPDPVEVRSRIGFLGDGNPLYKNMTPSDYLRFYGQCYRMRGRELEVTVYSLVHRSVLRSKVFTLP